MKQKNEAAGSDEDMALGDREEIAANDTQMIEATTPPNENGVTEFDGMIVDREVAAEMNVRMGGGEAEFVTNLARVAPAQPIYERAPDAENAERNGDDTDLAGKKRKRA